MSTERDTQFMGFANLLWDDLVIRGRLGMKSEFWRDTADPKFTEELKRIIAQRAYDLVYHALDHSNMGITFYPEDIPDLTEWPDEPK